MEVSGVVFRPLPCFSGAGIDALSPHYSSSKPSLSLDTGARFSGELRLVGPPPPDSRSSVRPSKFYAFSDNGHVQYYYGTRCDSTGGKKEKEKEKEKEKDTTAKKMKKRLKLLKGLSRDLSTFSEMGFGLDPDHVLVDQVKGKMISEAAELLLEHLQADEKELKRKRKEEKAKLKAARMQRRLDSESSSGSSSESSDSECGEVIDMSRLNFGALAQPMPKEMQPVFQEAKLNLPSMPTQVGNKTELLQPVTQEAMLTLPSTRTREGNTTEERGVEVCSSRNIKQHCCTGTSNGSVGCDDESSLVTGAKKIEVCMGGKCKKSGAAALLEEFQRLVGVEGAVAGCKCMGKCRDGPNVRVQAEAVVDSVRTPTNPLCIGVGLEDVGLIVANFFGENQKDLDLAAAS